MLAVLTDSVCGTGPWTNEQVQKQTVAGLGEGGLINSESDQQTQCEDCL